MNSLLMIFCALALLITVTAKREHKCDWNSYEYLCLVGNACIKGTREPISDRLIVFDPQTQSLKENEIKKIADCDLFLKIRNLNGKRWLFELQYRNIELEPGSGIELIFGDTFIFECGAKPRVGSTFANEEEPELKNEDEIKFCRFVLKSKVGASDDYKHFMLPTLDALSEGKIKLEYSRPGGYVEFVQFTGDIKEMLLNVARTRGCDDSLVLGFRSGNVDPTMGQMLSMNAKVVGKEAEIECQNDNGGITFISTQRSCTQRACVFKFPIQVHSVFCAGNVWAYRDIQNENNITYLGNEMFKTSCYRDYCFFCGEIFEDLCATCKKHTTNGCSPKCPNDLWYFGGGVVKSPLTCKPTPANKKTGVWMAVSNGVDVPVQMASCWVGLYPIPYEEPKRSCSLVAASWIALTTIAIVINI